MSAVSLQALLCAAGILQPECVKIPESAWQDYSNLDSGHVSIDEIQVCSLRARKPGQYYR